MTEVTRCSCWHQNFIPKGLSAPALGLYTCINHEKNCIKSDFKEIFLKLVPNDHSDKSFLLTSKFCPLELAASDLQLYTFIKSWEDVYKVRLKRFFLNLQQMTIVMRSSCWHQNFGLNGLSAPAQGLCLNFFFSITADFNISSALRWAIQDQWSSGFKNHCKTLINSYKPVVMLNRSLTLFSQTYHRYEGRSRDTRKNTATLLSLLQGLQVHTTK